MQNRVRLLMGASALLYMGPLLAGLSGMGWAALPVFMALFALWLVVMRPAQWPRDLSVWTSETAVAAAAQLAVNALIVIALFGIGRGIGGVAGYLPFIPPFLPVALSFLAVPLSRWAANPATTATLDPVPETTQRQISDPPNVALAADEMVAVLLSLPPDSDPMLTADAVDAAMKGPNANARLQELQAVLGGASSHRALREAVILWATDPARHPAEGLHSAQELAFTIAGADPVLLHLFAHRGGALLAQQPDLGAAFPKAVQIERSMNASQPENLRSSLSALAQALGLATASKDATSRI